MRSGRTQVKRLLVALVTACTVATFFVVVGQDQALSGPKQGQVVRRAATGDLKPATITTTTSDGKKVTRTLPFFSNATLQAVQDALNVGAGEDRLEGADAGGNSANTDFSDIRDTKATLGCAKRD